MAESSQTHPYLQEVGRRIKALRKERGFTLADLGENIGLDKSNTHRLEQGKNFTLLTLLKIATCLNLHPTSILDVPLNTEFAQIEKDIAAKKKARRARENGKEPQISVNNNTDNTNSSAYESNNKEITNRSDYRKKKN